MMDNEREKLIERFREFSIARIRGHVQIQKPSKVRNF